MQFDPATLLPLIVADVFQLAGMFRTRGEAVARTVGQTQARWQVLSAASTGPRTVPQLARRLGVSRQAVQRLADLLAAEGAARFEPNPDHRASPFLILTPAGCAALGDLTAAAAAFHDRIGPALTARFGAEGIATEKLAAEGLAAEGLAAEGLAAVHAGLRALIAALEDAAADPPEQEIGGKSL